MSNHTKDKVSIPLELMLELIKIEGIEKLNEHDVTQIVAQMKKKHLNC